MVGRGPFGRFAPLEVGIYRVSKGTIWTASPTTWIVRERGPNILATARLARIPIAQGSQSKWTPRVSVTRDDSSHELQG